MRSNSAAPSTRETLPISWLMMRCACAGSAASRTVRISVALRARATRLRSTYITPSTKPQAMLQPIAATSMSRTSSRPLSTTLMVPVKVSTMNRPNSTSEMRSIGSSTAELPVSVEVSVIGIRWSQAPEACRTRRDACH